MTKFTYPPLSNLVFTLSLYMELQFHVGKVAHSTTIPKIPFSKTQYCRGGPR